MQTRCAEAGYLTQIHPFCCFKAFFNLFGYSPTRSFRTFFSNPLRCKVSSYPSVYAQRIKCMSSTAKTVVYISKNCQCTIEVLQQRFLWNCKTESFDISVTDLCLTDNFCRYDFSIGFFNYDCEMVVWFSLLCSPFYVEFWSKPQGKVSLLHCTWESAKDPEFVKVFRERFDVCGKLSIFYLKVIHVSQHILFLLL